MVPAMVDMGADFDEDLDVDESDLADFGFAYFQEFTEADLNDDGKVDTDSHICRRFWQDGFSCVPIKTVER